MLILCRKAEQVCVLLLIMLACAFSPAQAGPSDLLTESPFAQMLDRGKGADQADKKQQEKPNWFSARRVKADLTEYARTLENPFIAKFPREPQPEPVAEEPFEPEPAFTADIVQDPEPEVPAPNFQIQGLVWDTDRPQAIINGDVYSSGEILSGWEITDIQKQGITVRNAADSNIVYTLEP
ncbi:MAG: hypothetical protein ACLFPX_06865 [Candidatus Omnitrophota bacterium]